MLYIDTLDPLLDSSYAPGSRKSKPPPKVCANINRQVHSSLALDRATFDFSAHVKHRSYLMHKLQVGCVEVAMLLDKSVLRLLPRVFEAPPLCPANIFEIASTGNKGLGMFACCDIPAGGVVLIEHPIVVVPFLVGLDTPLSELYVKLLECLPPKLRQELMQLANCRPSNEYSWLEGVVYTNALGIQLDVPDVPHSELSAHRAIFSKVSRCNHSCSPNAKWEWSSASFSLSITAVRPIAAGEEICINYIPTTQPLHTRQSTLRSVYGFDCRCDACTSLLHCATSVIQKSDHARVTLDQFWSKIPTFEEWCTNTTLPDDLLIDAHSFALQLIEQEGLQVLDDVKHIDAIAMCYGALEEVSLFQLWVERARDIKVHMNPTYAIVFSKWLSNPMAFPAWGWRKTPVSAGKTRST